MRKLLKIILILGVLSVLIFIFCYSIMSKKISEIKLTKVNLAYSRSYVFKDKKNIEKLLRTMENLKKYKFLDNLLLAGEKIVFEITYTNGKRSEKVYENIQPLSELFEGVLETTEAQETMFTHYYYLDLK